MRESENGEWEARIQRKAKWGFGWATPLSLMLALGLSSMAYCQSKQAASIGLLTSPAQRERPVSPNRQWRQLAPLVVPAGMMISEPYAWRRTDRYVPPDYENFFPDDPEGGRVLDELFSGKLGGNHSPADVLAAVRRGLRNTKVYPSQILAQVGNGFVWGAGQQDPRAIELLYHASDVSGPFCHDGMYYGLCVLTHRTPNVVRAICAGYAGYGPEIQRRILWGLNRYGDKAISKDLFEQVLTRPDGLDDNAIVSALDLYEEFTGQPFARTELFSESGKFVIGFTHNGVEDERDLRTMFEMWCGDSLIRFVVRVDRGTSVGVGLVRGIGMRNVLLEKIAQSEASTLIFAETFTPAVLQSRQLREFVRYLPGGLPSGARPNYAPVPSGETFAWDDREAYQPPNFDGYFDDDPEAGSRLQQLYENRQHTALTARQQLELIRRGLRRCEVRPASILAWASTIAGWPSDPMTKEIFYHAADPQAPQKIRYNAIYFGLRGWWVKPPNVLRLFAEIILSEPFDRSLGSGTVGSIAWSLRQPEEKKVVAEFLDQGLRRHDSYSTEKLANLTTVFEGLADRKPDSYQAYKDRGYFCVGFRHKRLTDPARVEAFINGLFRSEDYFVKFIGTSAGAKSRFLAVVRGMDGADRAVRKLKESKQVSIDYAVPAMLFKQADPDRIPLEELRPYFE